MTSLFPGAYYAVITLMVVLELGKLASVTFLHRFWSEAPKLLRTYLITAIFTLMFINLMGAFGFLSKAHIDQEIANSGQTQSIELIDTQIKDQQLSIDDITKQISQIDANIDKLTSTGKAQTSLAQATQQRKTRDVLVTQKQASIKVLEGLEQTKQTDEINNKKVAADFGPLTYIADIFYGNPTSSQMENVVRWIITILVMVFDPLALALLISSQFMFMNARKIDISKVDVLDINHDITK